ncbi:MAG: hypothetical protein HYV27_04655 [Candidatus Hydrogenedentes bacterium]|nr:hypothetical protein [Candidatus Hydrogenedentota bacterium]
MIRSALFLLTMLAAAAALHAAAEPIPEHAGQATPPPHVLLLPNHDRFVFTIYSSPNELNELQSLVAAMQRDQLGNGFDPGPPAGAQFKPLFGYLAELRWPVISYPNSGDMQVKEGRCRLTDEDVAAFRALDDAGVFHGVQLGEWGYFLHNLSFSEEYFRGLYGKDFDRYKHLMKPADLRGYDTLPTSRGECYAYVKDYFETRNRYMRGRNISVTGHSHYEAYAPAWGAKLVGLEIAENIAYTQSKFAFARGASRQWGTPWSVQVSPWFHGSCTTRGPLVTEGNVMRGADAGHSLSLYRRMWLHAWFAGAAMVTPENSIEIFFERKHPDWTLTEQGRAGAAFFQFTQTHDRGVPHVPVAIVLDELAGFNAFMRRPWGILENTAGDLALYDLFEQQIFPGSDHFHAPQDPVNPEISYLRPTPYGESFDVFLSTAAGGLLRAYPAILVAGDHTFTPAFAGALEEALRAGSRVLLQPAHADALGAAFARLQAAGTVEVLEAWTHPATNRPAAIADARLRQLAQDLLPIAVSGDPVQYQINQTPTGWAIELVNNHGVIKRPREAALTDPAGSITVTVTPKFQAEVAREWVTGAALDASHPIALSIPPGETRFVEYTDGA